MTAPSSSLERQLLLGSDFPTFGEVTVRSLHGDRTALAISAGSDSWRGARGAKAEAEVPNEDAVLAIEDDERTLLAVADSHWGHRASHELLNGLSHLIETAVPRSPLDILGMLPRLAAPAGSDGDGSETTLLIAVVDRARHMTFGASVGDSACFILTEGTARRTDRPDSRFATPWRASSLDPRRANEFAFETPPGARVLVCTDGIHECCYGRPDASIGLRHLAPLHDQPPLALTNQLSRLALDGVDSHPGGQDNLALAVTLA